jgi:hypothetical protein
MRKWIAIIPTLVVTVIAGFVLYFPYSPAGRQRANMTRAQEHIAVLLPKVRADRRFDQVRLAPYTGLDGSLGVFGEVSDEASLSALKQLVADSHPPMQVACHVVVIPPAESE